MKTVLFGIYALIYGTFLIPVMLILTLVGLFSKKARTRGTVAFVRFALKSVKVIVGVKVEVQGLENMPKEPCVVASNHRGIWDIISLYLYCPIPTGIVSKKEMRKIPMFGWVMNYMGCEFLDRDDLKSGLAMINNCTEKIKNGQSILIFPEGTRSKDHSLSEFKEGSLKMAKKANVPVVPVAIVGTDEILENHAPWMKGNKVKVSIGQPIRIDELERSQKAHVAEMVQSQVSEMLKTME